MEKQVVVIDGVIFQLQANSHGGIKRVWKNLIPKLAAIMPEWEFIFLCRNGFDPEIPGIQLKEIPIYSAYFFSTIKELDWDDAMLGQICAEEMADVFISTYYTRAPGVSNIMLIHDLIPEVMGFDLNEIMWIAKRRAISYADSFFAVSQSTRDDLQRLYDVDPEPISVAYNGLSSVFTPASGEEIKAFREKWGIHEPYFMLIGNRDSYKNGIIALKGFSISPERKSIRLIAFGGEQYLLPDEVSYSEVFTILPPLENEDLRCAYSGAKALIYPSRYEGFGLPVAEALACGCPVITGMNSSLPEVGGDGCLYVNIDDPNEVARAMVNVCDHVIRQRLVDAGMQHVRKFTWDAMAHSVKEHLISYGESKRQRSSYGNVEKGINVDLTLKSVSEKQRFCNILISGNIYFKQGRYREAEEKFKEALSVEGVPDFAKVSVHYNLGSVYEKEGLSDKAKMEFESVLIYCEELVIGEKRKFAGGAHFHLGCIYQGQGKREMARQHLEECLQIIPNHRRAKELL